MQRVQVVSTYSISPDWSAETRQIVQARAHQRLTALIADAVSPLQPGQAALIHYGPVEQRSSPEGGFGLIACTLRVTIEPYRTA